MYQPDDRFIVLGWVNWHHYGNHKGTCPKQTLMYRKKKLSDQKIFEKVNEIQIEMHNKLNNID